MFSYKPMLALEASKPFSSGDWIFEIKWDGFRAIAYVNSAFSLKSRNGKELKATFPDNRITSNIVSGVACRYNTDVASSGDPATRWACDLKIPSSALVHSH